MRAPGLAEASRETVAVSCVPVELTLILLIYFACLPKAVDPEYAPPFAVKVTRAVNRAGLSQPEKFSVTLPLRLAAGAMLPNITGKAVTTLAAGEH